MFCKDLLKIVTFRKAIILKTIFTNWQFFVILYHKRAYTMPNTSPKSNFAIQE